MAAFQTTERWRQGILSKSERKNSPPLLVVFIPPQCGVELRLWGGKTPHTKTGGVEFSTPKLHPTVGWSVGWSGGIRLARSARKFPGLCAFKGKPLKTDGAKRPKIHHFLNLTHPTESRSEVDPSSEVKLLIFAEKIILFENQRQFLNSFNLVSANTFAAKLLLSGVPTQDI